ncbi:MAG: hypothetical protein HUU28_11700, partial [Planctomycetaceae bacterium]|nr:hypothetical protein [Planctomycetaceae bacterium]
MDDRRPLDRYRRRPRGLRPARAALERTSRTCRGDWLVTSTPPFSALLLDLWKEVGRHDALTESLERLSTDEVRLKVIHGSVGAITESDVMLASASNAIVLGFNVKAEPKAAGQAQASGVDVRNYNVIYEALNDLRAALAGMLAPEIRETTLGRAQVRQVFSISKLGPIAGSYVQEGKIVRNAKQSCDFLVVAMHWGVERT